LARDPYTSDFGLVRHPFIILEANPYVLVSFTVPELAEAGLPIVVTTLDPPTPASEQWVTAEAFLQFEQLYESMAVFQSIPGETVGRTIYIYRPRDSE
jgi:hypothetical protein